MKLIFKNRILIAVVILMIAILVAFFIIKIKNKNISSTQIASNEIYQSNQNSSSTSSEVWNSYSDQRYGFSLSYPSNLNIHSIYESKVNLANSLGGGYFIVNGGASFYQNDGYWIIIVDILNKDNKNSASSLNEWLKKENETNKILHQQVVIEKRIKIDGYDAIVTHIVSDYEGPDKYEKKTIFIKDGELFEISTRYTDHEKIWNSFKFTK